MSVFAEDENMIGGEAIGDHFSKPTSWGRCLLLTDTI